MVVLSSSGVLPFCPTSLHEHRQDIAYPTGCHLSSFQLVSGFYPCADRRVPSTRTTGAVTDASGHSVIRSNSQAKEGRRHHPDVSCPLCLCRTASPTASARHTDISFSFEAASARHMRLYRSNSFYRIHAHRKLKILLLLLSSLLSSACAVCCILPCDFIVRIRAVMLDAGSLLLSPQSPAPFVLPGVLSLPHRNVPVYSFNNSAMCLLVMAARRCRPVSSHTARHRPERPADTFLPPSRPQSPRYLVCHLHRDTRSLPPGSPETLPSPPR